MEILFTRNEEKKGCVYIVSVVLHPVVHNSNVAAFFLLNDHKSELWRGEFCDLDSEILVLINRLRSQLPVCIYDKPK